MQYSLIFLGQLPAMLLFCCVLEPTPARQGASGHGFQTRMCESECLSLNALRNRRRPDGKIVQNTMTMCCRGAKAISKTLRKAHRHENSWWLEQSAIDHLSSSTAPSLHALFHSNFPTSLGPQSGLFYTHPHVWQTSSEITACCST